MSEKIDNNVAALAGDAHNLGEFRTVYDAMRRFPNGGVEGDYITILDVKHFWNVNRMSWGILKDKEDHLVQMVEDMIGLFKTKGYLFAGMATPETVPVSVLNTFYLATIPGEYGNFGIHIEGYGIFLLRNEADGWSVDVLMEVMQGVGESASAVISQRFLSELLGEGGLFAGMATPETAPKAVKGNVYYMASEKGVYSGFGGIELDGSVLYIFRNTADGWIAEKTGIPIDPDLVVSNAEAIAKEAKEAAIAAKGMAEESEKLSKAAVLASGEATKTADLSLTKSSKNEQIITLTSGKVDDLTKALTDTTQKATEALGLAKGAVKTSDRGIPNGIPVLDGNGKVPQSQLPLTKTELVDSYESGSKEKAPTADALRRAFVLHQDDMVLMNDKLEAILNLVSDSTELGVSPTQINVTSSAQTVRVQVICNGEWNVIDVPAGVTVSPLRGTGNGSFAVGFAANGSTTDDVNGVFKVANSFGKEKTVNYTQYSASTRYVYELAVEPGSIDVSAVAGAGCFDVVSTRTPYVNDTPTGGAEVVSYTLSMPEGITWMRLAKARGMEQYEYDENLLEASRSTMIAIVQEGVNGKRVEVPFNQAKAMTYTEFKFSMVPVNAAINDSGAGGVYPAKITSKKTVTVNGREETTYVPYTVTYEGGVTSAWAVFNGAAGTITLPVNSNELGRSGAIVFMQDGVEANVIRVNVVQAAATIGWNYTFTITPSEIRFGNAAGSRAFEVTRCVKKKTINGVETGDEIQVAWDVSITSDVFVLNRETNSISALENTSAERSAELVFNRPELGADDRRVVNVIQEAGVVSWSYALEVSANPTSIAALNGSTMLTVVSTKQKYINGVATGEPIAVGWHGTSANGYLSGEDVSGSTWAMKENQTESARSESLLINQLEDGGKSKTLNFTQLAGTVTYDYTFNVSPGSIALNNAGTGQSVSVTSTRQKKINGVNSGGVENVNWSSAISGGFTINGASISAAQNNTESAKNGTATFTQSASGKQASVGVSQPAGSVTWEYSFGVSPGSMSFTSSGGTQNASVSSSKRKYINGIDTGVQNDVGYSSSASGAGFSSVGTSVSASENTVAAARAGSCTFTQYESGKTAGVGLSQSAGEITVEYDITTDKIQVDWEKSDTSKKSIYIACRKTTKINGKKISEEPTEFAYNLSENYQHFTVSKGRGFMDVTPHSTTNDSNYVMRINIYPIEYPSYSKVVYAYHPRPY